MLEKNINSRLSGFAGYGLDDLKKANLMNRVDSKFMFPVSWLPNMLQQLTGHYRVLDINGCRVSTYKNQYLDTPEMKFYFDHHNGKLNRYKVRQRNYTDTQTSFLEVKHKTNQRRTHKTRVCLDNLQGSRQPADFVSSAVGIDYSKMVVTQHSGYNRIALANEDSAERLTIDFNLWYSSNGQKKLHLNSLCIAELKQAKSTKNSPFFSLREVPHMTQTGFSKYCIGCALLYGDEIKVNRFKPVLRKLSEQRIH
ncbi:polyphosphate polymerase domain-containing protein [Reinekea marinisedimentorum]|uniref:VTC domain-containing protein n=1 Tax=Reinekea marinisedimentorum TaxID=230495 RepID=A0A4R3IBE0_9GAMM|nr:polyphosphate polymerase domain-containing protein [Reinekea marinisedimentorum]TCS43781.1 VTC domain-containing protein [Reinekea marinisedimentorum]